MTYFDYLNGDSEQEVVSVTDYYYLDPDGTPYLLARAMGDDPQIVDLDGDGSNELCAASPYSAQLFFRREGRLYAGGRQGADAVRLARNRPMGRGSVGLQPPAA